MYLMRNGKFMNTYYEWVSHPTAFEEWEFQARLITAQGMKQPATHIGELVDGNLVLFDLRKG